MKITKVETMVIALPNRWAYGWHGLQIPIGRYVILRLETDTGLVGLGEAPTLPDWGGEHARYYGEDPETAIHMIQKYFTPILIGADPRDISKLMAQLDVPVRGHMCAKSAIDLALHDLAGKAAGVPVYQLLGGAMRKKIAICHSVGLAPPKEAANEAAVAAADGIKSFQVKVDGDPETDCAVVAAIRDAVGDGADIYPDINQGYRTPKQAIASVKAMENSRISAVEQPVEGRANMCLVTAGVNIRVWTDEGVWTPQDAIEVIGQRAADAISIYYTKSGGLQRALHVGIIASAAGLPTNLNGALESGIGNAANLHLAAAMPGELMPSVIPVTTLEGREVCKVGGVYYTDDIVTEPFEYEDGYLTVPQSPGLGVELDPKKIDRYRVM